MNSFFRRDFSTNSVIFTTLSAVLISLAVYHFGTGNHSVIIPFLKVTINPDLYPHDYFVDQVEYYHTFLWDVLAFLVTSTGLSIEWVFFIMYLVCMIASTTAIYGIAVTLFENPKVGYLAVFIQLVYFIHNAGVGDEFLMDHLLKESQVALPLLLFAVYLFLNKSYKLSYFLLGLGFLIHALSAIYVIVFLTISLLITGFADWKKAVMPLVILALVSIPLVMRKLQHSPDSMHMFEAYLDWVEMLRARYAGHSFPFSWSIWKYVKAAVLIGLFIFTWRYKPKDDLHNVVKYGTFTVFGLWLLGVVFTELLPLPIFIQLQLFRSYTLVSLFAVVYWSNFFVLSMESPISLWRKCLILAATIGLIIMLPSEGNPIINEIHRSPGIIWKNNYLYIIIFGLMLMVFSTWFHKSLTLRHWSLMLLILMVLITSRKLMKEGLSISSQLPHHWVDVQHWARNNSKQDDLFIVPPDMRGFRIDSERSIVGDYKDGIQMYFNPEFGYQWKQRMELLGAGSTMAETDLGRTYLTMDEERITAISDSFSEQHTTIYMVSSQARSPGLDFPLVYENEQYTVHKVR